MEPILNGAEMQTSNPIGQWRQSVQGRAYIFLLTASLIAFPLRMTGSEAFQERTRDELPETTPSMLGDIALRIKPDRWRFAETENFIIVFRRATEARKVAREAEHTLAFVASELHFEPEAFQKKSFVFVFEDRGEWGAFLHALSRLKIPVPEWAASFAYGDELFLNVRTDGTTGRFDSHTLAHETTHAAIARLYPNRDWPRWLDEGIAEYMASASIADRKNQRLARHQRALLYDKLSPSELASLREYPTDQADVAAYYQSAERLIRFLRREHPPEKLRGLLDAVSEGSNLQEAVMAVYPETYSTFEAFESAFEKYVQSQKR